MPRIGHIARKEWPCGICPKPIKIGERYTWKGGTYEHPERCHKECGLRRE